MLPSQQGQHGLRLVMVGGFWMSMNIYFHVCFHHNAELRHFMLLNWSIQEVGSVLRLLGES